MLTVEFFHLQLCLGVFLLSVGAKCTTASQPQSLAIFCVADEMNRSFGSEKQICPFVIVKCIATTTVSLPQKKNRLLESGQACRHHLPLFNVGGLTVKPLEKPLRTVLTAETNRKLRPQIIAERRCTQSWSPFAYNRRALDALKF